MGVAEVKSKGETLQVSATRGRYKALAMLIGKKAARELVKADKLSAKVTRPTGR
jgi:hypothetical protein